MPNLTLYHNPRCSKSRQALALLNERGLKIDLIEYLKTGLTKADADTLYQALKDNDSLTSALGMIRVKEAEYGLAGLSKESSDAEIITALVAYPKLLERPILLKNGLAAIGRPIENIEALLND
jgi:arsenate reductase